MAFDAERATWINTAGVCAESGTSHCRGMLGIDHNNRKEIHCSSFDCRAILAKPAVATTVQIEQQ
ncbi:MAG: hypothetical protein WAQ24_05185 [Candidatus Saccharimonadales bacterium]